MKAPSFWWTTTPTRAATLLAPLGAVYGAVTAARMRRPGAALPIPVLCVGNLVAGGAGKTPTVLALVAMLQAEGRHPVVLSRGYGRRRSAADAAVVLVDPARHDATIAGDEPLLLAGAAPTFVGADRRAAAQAAIAAGADLLILDDGLQSPALRKTWTLAVADGGSGIGNGLCVPAGPLRAPVAQQWSSIDMLCVIGPGEPGEGLARAAQKAGCPVTRARLVPDDAVLARWRGRRLFAFAGIGRPEKFFATLREAGLAVDNTRAFPDHHVFTPAEIADLTRAAGGALLVTTAKDRVRLPAGSAAEALPVRLVFDQPERLRAAMPLSP